MNTGTQIAECPGARLSRGLETLLVKGGRDPNGMSYVKRAVYEKDSNLDLLCIRSIWRFRRLVIAISSESIGEYHRYRDVGLRIGR
jgi:hypothetical protein